MPSSMLQKGKATCLEENVYVKFQAIIPLNNIFHLPLVPAEYKHSTSDTRSGSATPDKTVTPSKGPSRLGTNSIPTSKQPTHDLDNLAEAIAAKASLSQPSTQQLADGSKQPDDSIAGLVAAVTNLEAKHAGRSNVLPSNTVRVYVNKLAEPDAIKAAHMPSQAAPADATAHSDDSIPEASLRARYNPDSPAYGQDETKLDADSIRRFTSTDSDA